MTIEQFTKLSVKDKMEELNRKMSNNECPDANSDFIKAFNDVINGQPTN